MLNNTQGHNIIFLHVLLQEAQVSIQKKYNNLTVNGRKSLLL